MSRLISISILVTILLSACAATPVVTPASTQTATPLMLRSPETTADATPTAPIPSETPIPAPEIRVGMTADMTMADCNQIEFAKLDTQITAITTANQANYETIGLTPDKVGRFYNQSNGLVRHEDIPWSFAELIIPEINPQAISCNVLHMDNGTDMLTLTIPIKAPDGNQVIPMTFALDDEGMKTWYTEIQHLESYGYNNTQTVFTNLLEKIRSEKPLTFTIRPWIATSHDNTNLIPQWENSNALMAKKMPLASQILGIYPRLMKLPVCRYPKRLIGLLVLIQAVSRPLRVIILFIILLTFLFLLPSKIHPVSAACSGYCAPS